MIVALDPQDGALAAVATATGDAVVVVIRPGRDAGDLSLVRAAIAAAAMARAPRRINAVQAGPATDAAGIDRAVAFLLAAPAITGQTIDLS